jgi:hypothetical protein
MLVLESIFEAKFLRCSYDSARGRTYDAVAEVHHVASRARHSG